MRACLNAFYRWQNLRLPWLVIGVAALILNLLAHYVFQNAMGLAPCEYCVYIRFGMFCIFFGCLICAINPQNNILRWVFGYILTGYGIIQGALWNWRLAEIHTILSSLREGGDFFAINSGAYLCSMVPSFPLNLPLHKWFPGWFNPTGGCGDVNWSLFGFNMAESLFLFYGIYLIAFVLMVAGWFWGKFRNR